MRSLFNGYNVMQAREVYRSNGWRVERSGQYYFSFKPRGKKAVARHLQLSDAVAYVNNRAEEVTS
jgi:hypothetical protein